MLHWIKKIFGTAHTRTLRRYQKLVSQVNAWEEKWQTLSDDELRAKTEEFKNRLAQGESIDNLLPEAYAAVKNTCRRLCGTDIHVSGYNQKWDMIPYDVQILGAIGMHFGAIAEMQTGEGKTLTASMPLYLNALTGKPVHLVTVNDYLVDRDCQWIGTIFTWLGLSVRALTNSAPPSERKEIYAADIVYGTASEFGFDYLRDNSMAQSSQEQCQRGHYFAMIDEVDSILIDEARTPLIISGPAAVSKQMYDELKEHVFNVVRLQRDFCNHLASEARKTIEHLGWLTESSKPKLSKEQETDLKAALCKLWVVQKGTPQNKVFKRLKEDPEIRAEIEKWDTYFYHDSNKEERASTLADLYIVIDEKASEYELTDKGIQAWGASQEDFTMLDLGYEYALIDEDTSLESPQKIEKKVLLREEDSRRKERAHNVRQLFRAHLLMEKDIDYIVAEGKIVIIDENTGRPQPGRRFSDGLHQAIEAKEGVAIQGETQTYATITLQNYFRLYKKLSGMTGTAMTEAAEFKQIYKLDVLAIPTYRACQRKDADDEIYMTEREKYNAILKEIQETHAKGRPILIGTESVEVSEKLSRILKQNKLEHTVLNAKNHAQEAAIIAESGNSFAIMVATNMAGRGTDIKLKPGVAERGGLHVIGTTRHTSRRIDRQLRGRSARLGDPGSSKFYVSFEDPLMRMFTSPGITRFLQKFRPPEGEPISAEVLNKSIETAQKRVERRNFMMRKHTLEYDDVMNKQRVEIYAFRNEVLHSKDLFSLAKEAMTSVIYQMAEKYVADGSKSGENGLNQLANWLTTHFPITFQFDALQNERLSLPQIQEKAAALVMKAWEEKLTGEKKALGDLQTMLRGKIEPESTEGFSMLEEVVRSILLRSIDKHWQDHLLHIDHLRTEVSMRAVGQKDPLIEFKQEAFALFDHFCLGLHVAICHSLFRFQVSIPRFFRETEDATKGDSDTRNRLASLNLS